MNLKEISDALTEHAVGTDDLSGSGFADISWRHRYQDDDLELSHLFTSLSGLFQALIPHVQQFAKRGVPLPIASAVAEILSRSLELTITLPDRSDREALASFAWRVACAWDAVLAGDIYDIVEHVSLEASGRRIPPL